MLLGALVLIAGAASNADARERRQRPMAYQPKIICGQTGCFEIPPGCGGELRRTGKSVVAVVLCDRK
jgi:hypothetical protein